MLSSVSKLADKNFIIGFFLPALVALVATVNIFPCPTWMGKICIVIASDNPLADLTYLALVVWVIAVVLLTCNYQAYQLFEGYSWPVSRMSALKRRNLAYFKQLTQKYDTFYAVGDDDNASTAKTTLLSAYPRDESKILPTRFGNAIRAFEIYPTEIYGADAVSVWLRLAAIIPKTFQTLVNDARAQVDFLLNMAIVGPLVGLAAATRLVTEFAVADFSVPPPDLVLLLATLVAGVLVGVVSYRWAVERVSSWGNLVMSAFDLYLPALAKQLGYCLPAPESQRYKFWEDISRVFTYRRQMVDDKWKLVPDCNCVKAALADGAADEKPLETEETK
jgi:hypothetical protein